MPTWQPTFWRDVHVVFREQRPFWHRWNPQWLFSASEVTTNGPLLPECVLSALFDFSNTFHRFYGSLYKLAVVANWDVSALFEINGSVLEVCNINISLRTQCAISMLTMVISLPAAFRKAFVHRTFRGLRFILIR
jgi:hypothetical protein